MITRNKYYIRFQNKYDKTVLADAYVNSIYGNAEQRAEASEFVKWIQKKSKNKDENLDKYISK